MYDWRKANSFDSACHKIFPFIQTYETHRFKFCLFSYEHLLYLNVVVKYGNILEGGKSRTFSFQPMGVLGHSSPNHYEWTSHVCGATYCIPSHSLHSGIPNIGGYVKLTIIIIASEGMEKFGLKGTLLFFWFLRVA